MIGAMRDTIKLRLSISNNPNNFIIKTFENNTVTLDEYANQKAAFVLKLLHHLQLES